MTQNSSPLPEQSSETTESGQIELIGGAARHQDRMDKAEEECEHDFLYRGPSAERVGFVGGLFNALQDLLHTHTHIVLELGEIQGRFDISERNLRATRDHLLATVESSGEHVPKDWRKVIDQVRFLGARLGDAAIEVLKNEDDPCTLSEIHDVLNNGGFHFRTGTPLREIHAALIRQPGAKRDPETDTWRYELPQPMREVRRTPKMEVQKPARSA